MEDLWLRNFWDDLWHPYGPLSRVLDRDFFAENTEIKDRMFFDKARQEGRGVIIVSAHFCFTSMIFRWVNEVEQIGSKLIVRLPEKNAKSTSTVNYARELREASELLKDSGVSVLIADAYQGKNGVEKKFMGKIRPFYRGAWELAHLTGAVVIPAWIKMDMDAKYIIQFFPPFSQPAPSLKTHKVVEHYLDQYIPCWKSSCSGRLTAIKSHI